MTIDLGNIDADALARRLHARRDYADDVAWMLERRVGWCVDVSIVAVGLASVVGFVAEIPQVRGQIVPWMISAIAAVGSGAAILRQRKGWRAKSNRFYEHRDNVDALQDELLYQCAKPVTPDDVKRLAQRYRAEKVRFGEEMRRLNDVLDDQGSSSARRGHG